MQILNKRQNDTFFGIRNIRFSYHIQVGVRAVKKDYFIFYLITNTAQ